MRRVARRVLICPLLVVVTGLGVAAAAGADAAGASQASPGSASATVSAGESTIGYGNARLNWDDAEPGLGPTSVTAADFGKLFDTTLPATTTATPNQIYAQPLVADGMVITATEDNEVAGLTPTGSVAWHVSLGTPFTPASCGDLVPHIGVTSTPVYDPATDAVYVASKIASGSADGAYKLHALDPTTGAERAGWPVTIAGTSSNGGQTFNPTTANQRPGLLLMDGSVYMGFASHCDHGPYVGYVIGANTSTRQLSIWSSEAGLGTSEAGIWQSGGGLVSDGPGSILVTTGNGLSPAAGPGNAPPGNLAESVVRLKVDKYGAMSAVDFFSPANNAKLDQDDADLGSGGPIALPDDFGTPQHPHLLLQSGKDGVVRVLDRDHLGGMGQGPGGTDDQLDSVQLKGMWGRFAAFSTSDGAHYVFSLPQQSPMQMLRITADSAGTPRISVVATSADSYAYTSGSPVVTSDDADGSSAVVWVVTCDSSAGTNAQLRAYALPSGSGPWTPLASFPLGTVAKFIQPATAGNRVYVGTRDGRVLAFGRPVQTALGAPSTEFGQAPVGQSTAVVTRNVTVSVQDAVTVDQISAGGPFSADPAGLLGTHAAGSSFDVPVTFTPTAAGSVSGALAILASTKGPDAEYDFGLHGTGTSPGLQATPGTLDFGDVNQGESASLSMTVTNTGSDTETIDSVTAPTDGSFTLTDFPADGMSLPSQASATITVQFTPAAVSDYTDQLVVTGSAGSVTVPLSGTGIDGHPSLSLSTTSLSFGNVALGTSKTLSFVVTNTGSAILTITKAAPPVPPFSVAYPVAEGLSLEPGDTATVEVTYQPTSAEPATDAYSITSDDGSGAHLVSVTGNNAPWTGAASWSGGCITLTGSATQLPASATSSPCAPVTVEQLSQNQQTHTLHLGATGSKTCLDVQNTKAATSPVQFSTCNGSTAQVWQWRSDDSVYNAVSGKCLDVPGASTKSGTKLDVVRCAVTSGQYWDLSALQTARGAISSGVAALNDLCLDDRHASRANDTAMQTYGCNRTPAQQITHVGSTLRVLGGCVDVQRAGTANHTLVQRYRCNGGVAQQWTAENDGALYNPHSKKCLDVPKGTTTPSTQVQLYTCNGSAAQRWTLPG